MRTMNLQIEFPADNAPTVLALPALRSFEASESTLYPPQNDGWVVYEFRITYVPEPEDSAQAEYMNQLHDALTSAGVQFVHRGNGVTLGDGLSNSTFLLKRAYSDDLTDSITFFAVDRAGFEAQLSAIAPGGLESLDGYEVVVTGLAAGDDDLQAPPFRSNR